MTMMLLCAVTANAVVQYKTWLFDFNNLSNANGIVMSANSYSASDGGNYEGARYIQTFNGTETSKLAFRYGGSSATNYGWWFRNDGNGKGLFHSDGNKAAPLAITGLRAGDIVTITCTSNDNLQYIKFDGNVHAIYPNDPDGGGELNGHDDFYYRNGNTKIISGQPIHITSDGDLILRNFGWNFITNIRVNSIKNSTYKITKISNNQTKFEFTSDGLMDYNDIAVPYMQVSFGAARNYVVVDNYQSHIYDWQEYEGVFTQQGETAPFSGNFYTFTPTGNGNVTLTGGYSSFYGGGAKVYLYRETSGNHSTFAKVTDQNGNWGNGWNSGNISFNVQAGYTYYICNKNDWGQQFNLQTLTFTNTFYLDPLAVIKDSSNPNGFLTTVHSASNVGINHSGRSYVKRHSENIDVSNLSMSLSNGQLSVSGIAFVDESANKGGTIIYHLDTNEGWADMVITIPYSAGWGTDNDDYGNRSWGHMWNFADPRQSDSGRNTTGLLELGRASNSTSKLSEEIAKREWNYAQRVTGEQGGFHDPMYTNVFDMEGDNADMIWETEGLWFETESNLSCLWNEGVVPALRGSAAHYTDYTTTSDPDRYIGLLPPSQGGVSSFTIPGLKDGDRVEIFLGSGEASGTDVPYFEITGAKDALGKPISGEYGCGGSMWRPSGGNYNYRSCYQFIKDGDSDVTPMKFTLKRGSMAKLYSIRIYRGDKSYRNHVERNTNADNYQMLNTYSDGSVGDEGTEFWWTLHHRGKGETLFNPVVLSYSGNLDLSSSRLFRAGNNLAVAFKSKIGQYGTFRLRIEGSDYTGDYVTDYADQSISVGYLEKMNYPYTWDFTDMKQWVDSYALTDEGMNKELSQECMDNKVNIWETAGDGYGLIVQNNSVSSNVRDDQVFSSGGQLYAGNALFQESRGLGIETSHGRAINSKMVLTSTGLTVSTNRNSEFVLRVPEVDGGAAVYVRAKKLAENGNRPYLEKCLVGSGAQQDFSKIIAVSDENTADEYVFVVKNASTNAQDIRIKLNNYEIKRIAVAADEKKVNEKGYASESRNHDIDAMLLPYFTGEDFKTYVVSNPDYDKLTLTLTDVGGSEDNHVMKAYTGCIIRRVGTDDNLKFNIFNDDKGFHLFVPDMHDTADGHNSKYVAAEVKAVNDQFMVPVLSEKQVPNTNTDNYVRLVYNGFDGDGAVWYAYTWDNQGDTWIPEANGMFTGLKSKVIFVRMNPNGNVSWDNRWNQTEDLTPQNGKTYTITGWNNGNGKLAGYWSDSDQATDMTNYVLTYKYKKLTGSTLSDAMFEGEEKFYRVYSGWDIWLRANSAYLQLPTESVLTDDAPRSARMFTFLFNDSDGQAVTGIDNIECLEGLGTNAAPLDVNSKNAVWYNIYGQRLDGRPAQHGIYIVNGKKVMVK